MLKPKRNISKQDLKKDPFLEFINDSQKWLQKRKKIIYQVLFGIVAVVLVVYFLSNSRSNSKVASETLLGKALLSQDLGDMENSKFQLQSLVDDFSSTPAGNQGKYYLGKMLFDDGEFETASEYLKEFVKKGNNSILMTTAYKILSEIALQNNDASQAEGYLQKGAKFSDGTVYEQEMSLLFANQLFENGKIDKAKNIVDDILVQENILFSVKKSAEELMGRIEGEN